MCGRYALTAAPEIITSLLRVIHLRSGLVPRYNIAPTQLVPVVRDDAAGERELVDVSWGLIPPWAKDRKIASRLINARSETAHEKPAFRDAFVHRRCVLPADGFYEWKKVGRAKQPYFVHRVDGLPMFFAGLWEQWTDKEAGQLVESCTILTSDANAKLTELHHRMPVVFDDQAAEVWLGDGREVGELKPLLRPAPDDWFAMHPVSKAVNSVANEGPELIQQVEALAAEKGQGEQGEQRGDAQLGLFD